ncbi:hypothetical protein, unlikely [Trypanosoma congolense IL3000]|uniref:Uncharacterized protein n=1 Tax=Trypanosoma congolense (strain IL3000) TaxID=1068625 RepID=F9W8X7_TRYCI|nr:hypothetical protein, unlikely [Trypanosoma congolense IL3000]
MFWCVLRSSFGVRFPENLIRRAYFHDFSLLLLYFLRLSFPDLTVPVSRKVSLRSLSILTSGRNANCRRKYVIHFVFIPQGILGLFLQLPDVGVTTYIQDFLIPREECGTGSAKMHFINIYAHVFLEGNLAMAAR